MCSVITSSLSTSTNTSLSLVPLCNIHAISLKLTVSFVTKCLWHNYLWTKMWCYTPTQKKPWGKCGSYSYCSSCTFIIYKHIAFGWVLFFLVLTIPHFFLNNILYRENVPVSNNIYMLIHQIVNDIYLRYLKYINKKLLMFLKAF